MKGQNHTISHNISKHLLEVYEGVNWTYVNLKDVLSDVRWKEATAEIYGCNSIATLVYHMTYYCTGVSKVLNGGPLESKDKYSFDRPDIHSEEDWQKLIHDSFAIVKTFAVQIKAISDDIMWSTFVEDKYGIYYRNLHGIIEHCHYHLGQIVILKKIIRQLEGI